MLGYGFLARTLLQQKRLLMQGFSFDVCQKLFYTVQLLTGNSTLWMSTEPVRRPEIPECVTWYFAVIFEYDMMTYNDFDWLCRHPKCLLLFCPRSVLEVPYSYLNEFPSFVWNTRQYDLALYSRVLTYQNPRCLRKRGVLFGSDQDERVHTINLEPLVNAEQMITQAQTHFRRRKHGIIVIQRAVKQWLYRPNSRFAQRIVCQLEATNKTFNKKK